MKRTASVFGCAELRDRFRDDETSELREVQRELEATSKNCRILQFKLRKTERRCDQLESERADYEEKVPLTTLHCCFIHQIIDYLNTTDVKSTPAYPYIAIFKIGLPFDHRVMP